MLPRLQVLKSCRQNNVVITLSRRRRRPPPTTTRPMVHCLSSFTSSPLSKPYQRSSHFNNNSHHQVRNLSADIQQNEDEGSLQSCLGELPPNNVSTTDPVIIRKEQLLRSLSHEISDNVKNLINRIEQNEESSSWGIGGIETEDERQAQIMDLQQQQSSKQKAAKSVRKVFQRRLKQERRKLPFKIRKMKSHYFASANTEASSLSVEEAWDQALREAGIPYDDPVESLMEETNDSLDDEINEQTEALKIAKGSQFEEAEEDFFLSVEENQAETLGDDKDRAKRALDDHDDDYKTENRVQLLSNSQMLEMEASDAMCKAFALLSILNQQRWRQIDSCREMSERDADIEDSPAGDREQNTTELDTVESLLTHSKDNNYLMKTKESNLLLARLLTADDASSEDYLMTTSLLLFNGMKSLSKKGREECGPDITTYRLLILALSRRFQASGEAVSLFRELSQSNIPMNSQVFLAGLQTCHDKHETELASRILYETFEEEQKFKPSIGAYLIVLDMLKYENFWREAIEIVTLTLQSNMELSDSDRDRLLLSLSQWPEKSRKGELLDTSELHQELLRLFEQKVQSNLKPGPSAWLPLLERTCKAAKIDTAQWDLAHQAFQTFLHEYPEMNPSKAIMRVGLEISAAKHDAGIAAELVRRLSRQQISSNFFASSVKGDSDTAEEDSAPHPTIASEAAVPYMFIRTALEISVATKDFDSVNLIFSCFDLVRNKFPAGATMEFYALGLLGYARYDHPDKAKNILDTMAEKGMNPSEELYGAVMHSLSTAGRRAEAQELFHEIECGLHGDKVKVGTSCFNALLLSYIQSEEWDKGLGLHEKMKSSQVAVDSSTVQGLLLAAYRSGGQEAVVSMVEEFIDSNTQMGAPSFDLVMKLLAPKEVTESNDRRQTLRSIGERYPAVKASTLNLMRAIRIAEVEDSRKPNPNSDSSDIQLRRSQAWKDATSYLLDFARVSTQFSATKKTGNKNSTSGSD